MSESTKIIYNTTRTKNVGFAFIIELLAMNRDVKRFRGGKMYIYDYYDYVDDYSPVPKK